MYKSEGGSSDLAETPVVEELERIHLTALISFRYPGLNQACIQYKKNLLLWVNQQWMWKMERYLKNGNEQLLILIFKTEVNIYSRNSRLLSYGWTCTSLILGHHNEAFLHNLQTKQTRLPSEG